MQRAGGTGLSLGVLGAGLVAAGICAAQYVELPPGPNRDLVERNCQSCHDLQMIFDTNGLSRENWEAVLREMTSNGLSVTPDERRLIVEYLATYQPPR
jgi:hypothetical protein